MTSVISNAGEKRLVFMGGRAHPELTDAVARELDIEPVPTTS